MLVFVPQILAVVALELPSALQTPLPAEAEGNARVVHGGAALMLGFLLFLPTFPAVCGALGCVFGPAGERAETAFTALALCLAGLVLPVVFAPALDTESPLQALLTLWGATSLLVLVPVQKRLLQASHTSVASLADSPSQSSVL